MTDELTSEQEAAVRRLLAEARHEAPIPADVAARLDEVLDDLVAQGAVDDTRGSGSVTELAGVRRRRRNAGRLLLAAAAVVVGGVTVGQTLGGLGPGAGEDSGTAGGDSLAEAPQDSPGRAEPEAGSGDAGGGDDGGGAMSEESVGPTASGQGHLLAKVDAPLALTSDNFATDVQRELGRTAAERRVAAYADYDGVQAYTSANGDFACADGPYGRGATLPAYYDAEEAVLVLRRPRAGIQRVDLLTCGTAVTLNSVELPAP